MKNKQIVLLCVALLASAAVGLSALAAIAKFNYVHSSGLVMDVTDDGAVVLREEENTPKAVTNTLEFDFGTMDPLTMGRYVFEIHNQGSAPLQLLKGETTCKCTLSRLTDNEIAPGEVGHVTLEWNTGRHRDFSHQAEVRTSDPNKPSIVFTVRGTVRMNVGIDPPELIFAPLDPDASGSAEGVIYSQIWDALDFDAEVTSAAEGIDWRVGPADEKLAKKYRAKVAYKLTVDVPAGRPRGTFTESLNLRVRQPGGEAEYETYEVPLEGEVLGRLAMVGSSVDRRGVLDLGVIPHGKGTKKRLMLKVRDEDRELRILSVSAEPSFIQTKIVPYKESAGLSYVEFEVPSTAPVCSFRGQQLGKVVINFDHPRIESLDLKVRLTVIE